VGEEEKGEGGVINVKEGGLYYMEFGYKCIGDCG